MIVIEVPVKTLDDEIARLEKLSRHRFSFVRDRIHAQLAALRWVRNGGKSPADLLGEVA